MIQGAALSYIRAVKATKDAREGIERHTRELERNEAIEKTKAQELINVWVGRKEPLVLGMPDSGQHKMVAIVTVRKVQVPGRDFDQSVIDVIFQPVLNREGI
jgi:hypothetical protein